MNYYVDTLIDERAQYQVHRQDCNYLPRKTNRLFLGEFENSTLAINAAIKLSYPKANGCYWCCRQSHKP